VTQNGREGERWLKLAEENGVVTWLDLGTGEVVSDTLPPAEAGVLKTLVTGVLEKRGWRLNALDENATLVVVDGEHARYQLLLITSDELDLLSCYCILPSLVRPAARPSVVDMLNRINWSLAIGNFDLDPDDGQVRFRSALHVQGLTPTETAVENLIDGAVATVDRCHDLFLRVERGDASPQAAAGEVRARARASLERERRR
jgi:hypothetical protein